MKNIGIIGCGNILETYLRSESYFKNLNFTSCADINMDLAAKTAKENNLQALTVEELLDDKIKEFHLRLRSTYYENF